MTATEAQAAGMGLAVIVAYVGLILYVLLRSAKSRPVEELPDTAGQRKRELVPAQELPPGFLSSRQRDVDGTLAEAQDGPNNAAPKEHHL